MLDITCCGCGENLAPRVYDAIEAEFKRREEEEAEGFPIPAIALMCVPCDVEMRSWIENRYS